MEFETLAIHAGQEPDPLTGAVTVPIYQTSTFQQDRVGAPRGGYEYSRSRNPTRHALEVCLAALEGGPVPGAALEGGPVPGAALEGGPVPGARGLAFASGLAAEDCVLRTVCRPGDHVVIPGDAYGGTFRLFARVFERWGLRYSTVDESDLDAVRAAVRPGSTRLVWCETPTNPLLGICDIAALATVAHDAGALLVVDNTFASPYLQQPLRLGADVVVHSTTKYLGGHSDVVGGALVAADPALGADLAYHQNAMGAVAGPFDAWLVLRGVKTLALRMEQHSRNAERLVSFLTAHAAVSDVHYPGLPSHSGHEVARRQMRRFGGMVSFRLVGGEAAALTVCHRARLFTLGESLGGVESLIEHPARMTHASVAGSALEVPGDLVRLSVGV
ncbi:MAG TPA: PLP-dependent transferase, partial [Mycobacteriales bacterium]|nr:PLP-dependent transferase [Mycobacteriales bacterium]